MSRTMTTLTWPASIAAISSPNPSRVISLNAEYPSSLKVATTVQPRRRVTGAPVQLGRHRLRRVVRLAQTGVHARPELGLRPVCLHVVHESSMTQKHSGRMRRLVAGGPAAGAGRAAGEGLGAHLAGRPAAARRRLGAAGAVDRAGPGTVGRAPGVRVRDRQRRRRLAGRRRRRGGRVRRGDGPGRHRRRQRGRPGGPDPAVRELDRHRRAGGDAAGGRRGSGHPAAADTTAAGRGRWSRR